MLEPSRTPLFGLAPGGVYPAVPVAKNAVRSYRTISPLPNIGEKPMSGGIFSAALSVDLRLPGVTWHPALWSPDFPLCEIHSDCLADSSGKSYLTCICYGGKKF